MGFFKRNLAPLERFERALEDRRVARERLAAQLSAAERALEEARAAAKRLVASSASAKRLARADVDTRMVEDRAKDLRAALATLDEELVETERALAEANAQRDRDRIADDIEAMATAIERAAPRFEAGAGAFMDAVAKGAASVAEATKFASSMEAVRREVLSAAELVCWELRATAARTRAGNTNVAQLGDADAIEENEARKADVA